MKNWLANSENQRDLKRLGIVFGILAILIVFFAGVSAFTEKETNCGGMKVGNKEYRMARDAFICENFQKSIADTVRNIFGLNKE
mgnify:CR=1 FL=1|jgi:hypothetical protein